jgi:predicted transcriptional regulator
MRNTGRGNELETNEQQSEIIDGRMQITWIYNTVIEMEDLKTIDKMVYIAICRFSNSKGTAYPGHETIAKIASCGTTSVKQAIKTLQEKGLLEVRHRFLEKGGKTSNLYIIKDPRAIDTTRLTDSRETTIPQSRDDYEGRISKDVISITKQRQKKGDEYTEEFETWWNLYPKKTEKKSAFKHFKKMQKKYGIESLNKGAKNYAIKVKQENREEKYIKKPNNFLNDELFLEFQESETPQERFIPEMKPIGEETIEERDQWGWENTKDKSTPSESGSGLL